MPDAATSAQAQSDTAVHAAATQASAALNKLSHALKQSGAAEQDVKQVDDMANAANDIASAAVGNAPPSAPPEQQYSPTPGESPGGLGSAIQDFAGSQPPA